MNEFYKSSFSVQPAMDADVNQHSNHSGFTTPFNSKYPSSMYKDNLQFNKNHATHLLLHQKPSSQMFNSIYRVYTFILFLLFSVAMQAQVNMFPEMHEKVQQTLKENGQTIRFKENKGQIHKKEVLYYFEGKKGSVYIEKNRIVFVAREYETIKKKFLEDQTILKSTHTVSLNIDGASPNPKLKLG